MDIEHDTAGGNGLGAFHFARKLFSDRMLHSDIEGKGYRWQLACIGQSDAVHVAQSCLVDVAFEASEASVIDVDEACHVARGASEGVDAPCLAPKAESGQPQLVQLLACAGCDFALEPDKSALGLQAIEEHGFINVRDDAENALDGLVDVDDIARIGKERPNPDIGCEDLSVAVEDIGSRGGGQIVGLSCGDEGCFWVIVEGKVGETEGVDAEDRHEAEETGDDTPPVSARARDCLFRGSLCRAWGWLMMSGLIRDLLLGISHVRVGSMRVNCGECFLAAL